MHLGKETRLVLDVPQHILGPYHLEGRIVERHVQGAPVPKGDPVLQANAGR